MLFPKDLNVFHDDNGTFIDISKECVDYGRDNKAVQLISAEDYLYIGLYKPFSQVFVSMSIANTNANTFTAQYYNGSTWNSLENFYDLSLGFTRSGFMSWSKSTNWASVAVNSETLYWIRLKPSSDHSATTAIGGLNIVFADDQDLKTEFSSVDTFLTSLNLASYVTYHQSVRDDIVQEFRNEGSKKLPDNANSYQKITKWDLLDIEEVKRGAIYACLSKIFFELSDNSEDKWYQRHKDYMVKANKSLELVYLSLDFDDDGKNDAGESTVYQSASLFRQ